jgi:hypothetical protein
MKQDSGRENNNGLYFIVGGLIVVVAIGGFVLFGGGRHSDETTVRAAALQSSETITTTEETNGSLPASRIHPLMPGGEKPGHLSTPSHIEQKKIRTPRTVCLRFGLSESPLANPPASRTHSRPDATSPPLAPGHFLAGI